MGDISFEVIIKDETYRKLGTWKFNRKEAVKFFKILNEQFGLGMKITDNVKDLDWLK